MLDCNCTVWLHNPHCLTHRSAGLLYCSLLPRSKRGVACYVTVGSGVTSPREGRSVCWPATIAAAAAPMLLRHHSNGCLTQLLGCYVTAGGSVYRALRSYEMSGVCDATLTSCCAVHVTLLPSKGCSSRIA
jgi:hypothetical protein